MFQAHTSSANLENQQRHIVTIFYDSWILPFCIPAYLLPDNSTQFVSKFFKNYIHLPWIVSSHKLDIPPSDEWKGMKIQLNANHEIALLRS